MKKWRPVGYMLLIKPDFGSEQVSKGGIVMAFDGHRQVAFCDTGVVVDIGPNAWKAYDNGEPWCKIGDRISYARHGGKIVTVPDSEEKLVLIADGDVRLVEENING
jgi:co-chaperonin GroES (HSP10)